MYQQKELIESLTTFQPPELTDSSGITVFETLLSSYNVPATDHCDYNKFLEQVTEQFRAT